MNRLLPAVLLLPALLAGCSDFATEPNRTPAALRVSPDSVFMTEGETAAFEIELLDEDGRPFEAIPSWTPPLWTSDRPELLEMDPSGVGTAVGAGESELLVELAGLEATARVLANPFDLQLDLPFDYITQSAQRETGDVPLIAGRKGFLRVFVRGDDVNWFRPSVRASFYIDGEEVHSRLIGPETEGVPRRVEEGNLALSYDAVVPADVLRPGVGVVIEVDPEGVVPIAEGSIVRVPAEGVLDLGVREVLPFRWTVVPVTQALTGLESWLNPDRTQRLASLAKAIFPLGDAQVRLRAPYTTQADLSTTRGWHELLEEIAILRWDDGSPDYYYGATRGPHDAPYGGIGYIGYPASIGMDSRADVMAHELGHNLNLLHAPCVPRGGRISSVDPSYPYDNGSIGTYGWDPRHERLQRPSDRYDLMSYCNPIWISDYHFERVIAHRDTSAFDAAFETQAAAALPAPGTDPGRPVLLVRGGVSSGSLRLEPALEWEGAVVVPQSGAYRVEGLDAGGAVLFSVPADPRTVDHGDDAQFLIAIPAERAAVDRLARLRLTGPEGTVERRAATTPNVPARVVLRSTPGPNDGDALTAMFDARQFPLAVVRDRRTGLIRAMSRTGRIVLPQAGPDRYDVVLSDGVRSHAAELVIR